MSRESRAHIVYWNQIKHFPVKVVKSRSHPFNLMELEMKSINPKTGAHELIGSCVFHLHDIMENSPISGSFDLVRC